ncbi:MAG TPA: chemotaxis protein CheA [Clostridia bacterium]|nr:chemotaxis protein CheA [Clostridia bacterium]
MAATLSHLGRTLDDLQERIMKARMLPLETLFRRFPRVVRDLAIKSRKRIRLEISGEQTELDRLLIEEIANPLLHIIRNAVDHGIEPVEERIKSGKPPEGTIHLSARYEESYTLISVRDDGRGIDPVKIVSAALTKGLISQDMANKLSRDETIGLIFLPGLSTSDEVTDISGRGVGLDVVKKNLETLNGTLEVKSEIGVMTEFILRVPLTLAIVKCLLVDVNGSSYAIPLNNIREVIRISESDFHYVWRYEHALVRGELLPVLRLSRILYDSDGTRSEFGVIVQGLGRQAMFVVDDLLGEQEVVMKSLGKYLGSVPGLLAASNLGDGRIVFVLDVPALLDERVTFGPCDSESEVMRRH